MLGPMSLKKFQSHMSRSDGLFRVHTNESVATLERTAHYHIVYKTKKSASGYLPLTFFCMLWALLFSLPILDGGERTTSVVAFRADWSVPAKANMPLILSISLECLIFWFGGFCLSSIFLHRALSSSRQVRAPEFVRRLSGSALTFFRHTARHHDL
jgi:hypothetical protein